MSRKILYITGSRADYGLMKSVLLIIHQHSGLKLEIAVTGMHLMDEFGSTFEEIKNDGFSFHKLNVTYENDTKSSMVTFIGRLICELNYLVEAVNPDIILVLGDRGEMLAAAIVGVFRGIPVAHIHGGERSSTVDDITRHAITKLASIHFPATEESAQRIIKMGEDPSNVFVVGAPGLDMIISASLIEKKTLAAKYGIDLSKPLILLLQHPVSIERDDAGMQMEATLQAISELKLPTILIYPNADAGGREMIEVIKKYQTLPFLSVYKNIPHMEFLSLLNVCSVLIGNSSSGIIEAGSFGIPVVNIGTRQEGRQRGTNVIDVGYQKEEIITAIETVLYDKGVKDKVIHSKNPYGDGKSGKRIAEILYRIPIDSGLTQKRMVY
jgi:GDP/UDP-N,N'-diacetylbacillosamine 2-epimerase (hydrolysing)